MTSRKESSVLCKDLRPWKDEEKLYTNFPVEKIRAIKVSTSVQEEKRKKKEN